MKKYFLLISTITLILQQISYSQEDTSVIFGQDEIEPEYYFAFNLVPNSMGGLYHLALIKPMNDGTYKIKQITKESFILQAMGKQSSLANPKGTDLFKKYQIENPNVIDDLWRLRYQEYPYLSREKVEPGWSTNDSIPFLPSPTQLETLKKFGLFKMSDYIMGENAFRLLFYMSKPEWIKLYKESF